VADSGSGELSEESAKRPFCAETGEGREKASWVEERTLRLPWREVFEEEKREASQAMARRIEGGEARRAGRSAPIEIIHDLLLEPSPGIAVRPLLGQIFIN
jgi:hypothetical protein